MENFSKNIENKSTFHDELHTTAEQFYALRNEISRIIVGNQDVINFALIAILCEGHILFEGPPGVAKTTLVKTLSDALGLPFKRIQFTPDLLPADLIGTLIYNQKTQEFETRKGPIFSNLILADEINRAPAKVQAALLEAMQEQQVTIGSSTFKLAKPFLVFATQNPIEQTGTYALPEAQVDRFMFKLLVHYPSLEEEKEVIKRSRQLFTLQPLLHEAIIFKAQSLLQSMYIDERIIDYIVRIVYATREPASFKLQEMQRYIQYGVSPRASLALERASRAYAFIKNRHFVIPDDVKAVAGPILRHRVMPSYEAHADSITNDQIISKILETVPVP